MDNTKKNKRPSRKGIVIKKHKGGRVKRFECRLTTLEDIIVNEIVKASGLSKSDWLMSMAQPTNPRPPSAGKANVRQPVA